MPLNDKCVDLQYLIDFYLYMFESITGVVIVNSFIPQLKHYRFSLSGVSCRMV